MVGGYDDYDNDWAEESDGVSYQGMAIFRHFKPETVKAMTARQWEAGEIKPVEEDGRTVADVCPLAWCLFYEHKLMTSSDGEYIGMPGGDDVAAAVLGVNKSALYNLPERTQELFEQIETEAVEFYTPWDNGEIKNLATAASLIVEENNNG